MPRRYDDEFGDEDDDYDYEEQPRSRRRTKKPRIARMILLAFGGAVMVVSGALFILGLIFGWVILLPIPVFILGLVIAIAGLFINM